MDLYRKASNLSVWPGTVAGALRAPTTAPLGRFITASFAMSGVVLALVWLLKTNAFWPIAMAAMGFYAVAIGLAALALQNSFPHRVIGLCNLVTLLRLALTSSLFGAALAPGELGWLVWFIAIIAFSLDGVDGWLARRSGLSSEFGARFDMEVDSAFALILAVLAMQNGFGLGILLLGLPRYLFALGQWVLPFLNGPLPHRFSRKSACVLQIAALVALIAPVDLGHWTYPIIAAPCALLLWSFAHDIRALWRAAT